MVARSLHSMSDRELEHHHSCGSRVVGVGREWHRMVMGSGWFVVMWSSAGGVAEVALRGSGGISDAVSVR